jgi:DNA-binding MarR family transcriptional regulator
LPDQKTIEQARYIFTTGKLLRRHIFSSLARVENNNSKCACSELSLAQFNLLMTVQAHGTITGVQLAAQLGVSPPSVSVMVERLVERGLLVRERSQEDRRKVVIRMSNDEALHFSHIEEQVLSNFVSLVEEIGEETVEQWVEVLKKVQQVLQQRMQSEIKAQKK